MANIPRHSPEEANKLITEQGYTYVDVRTEAEYEAGHPAGAYNVPVMLASGGGMVPNPDFLRVMNGLFAKDAKLVVGCRSGARSLRAAEMLAADGYTSVVDQRAGFEGPKDPMGRTIEAGWKSAGLPVATATPHLTFGELKKKVGV